MRTRSSRHPPARKRFGQHFLEAAWAGKVVQALALSSDATVLEIGPGGGALTTLLGAAALRVIAFEIDRDLAASLRTTAPENVRVVEGDFLRVTAEHVRQLLGDMAGGTTSPSWTGSPLRVVGNLPYNVASPIMFKLVDLFRAGLPIVDATLMLQREVADRLLAPAGSKEYGVLSILIGRAARIDRLLNLPPGAFRPVPKVRSTVVRLNFHAPDPPVTDEPAFASLVQSIFTRRRKTVANALLAYSAVPPPRITTLLGRAGLDPRRRPETLTPSELARLADLSVFMRA